MLDADAINDALWRWRVGVLQVTERLERVKLVIGNGVILLPAPGYLPDGSIEDGTLSLPDEGEDSLSLQVELRALREGSDQAAAGLIDRWEAYHGRPVSPRFAVAAAQGARIGPQVVDEGDIELVNTLGNERTLLRRLNADRPALQIAAARRLGFEVIDPTAVGIDQRGVDLRTRTGVIRVPARERMDDGIAERFVNELLTAEAPRA